MQQTSTAPVARFSALNPNLPRLAAKAALDLDIALLSTTAPGELPSSVSELIQKLRSMESLSIWADAPGSSSYLQDPVNGDIFKHSLNAAKLGSLSQLDATARKVMASNEGDNRTLFEALRDFFVALTEFASYKREVIFSNGNSVLPYRVG